MILNKNLFQKYPALFVYFVSSILAIIGFVSRNESLLLIAKPIIVPAIFYYYLQRTRFKLDWLFTIAILSSFISDMFVLFKYEDEHIPIAFLNMFVYLIFLYFLLKDVVFNQEYLKRSLYFVAITAGFLIILYIMLDLIKDVDTFSSHLYVVYGLVLTVLATLSVYTYIFDQNIRSFYALLMCICFITTDIFYTIFNFYLQMQVFIVVNLIAQFVSYYYMVRYITAKKIKKN